MTNTAGLDRIAAARTALSPDAPPDRGSARSGISSFIVMDVMRAAAAAEAAGHSIMHMEVGQPGTPAPKAARDAAKHAIDRDTLGYTLALGHEPLRARIARLYRDWYGLDLDSRRIVITTGSSAGFVLAFLAAFDVGDAVALPSPGYPCYRHILTALGCRPDIMMTTPEMRWMPTRDQLLAHVEANPALRGLLVASPANPTGTMLTPERLAELVGVCDRLDLRFMSDEIYHGLGYGMPQASALQSSDRAIVINSFSKYFSMTGWRVGWLVVPDALVPVVERLQQNLFIAPPAISQVAALGAFDGEEELTANRRVYAANRDMLLAELPKAGFASIVPADGAFYLYCDISNATGDSLAFTRRMLAEARVAATPGLDFDEARGGSFVRFSYAGSSDDMAEAVRRLTAWGMGT